MSRYNLTDFEWRVIEPLLPNKPRGIPRVDDRRMLSGISGKRLYRERNVVERFFSKLKHFRRIATRYDKAR